MHKLHLVAVEDAGIIKIRDATIDNEDYERMHFHRETGLSQLLLQIKLLSDNLPLLQR